MLRLDEPSEASLETFLSSGTQKIKNTIKTFRPIKNEHTILKRELPSMRIELISEDGSQLCCDHIVVYETSVLTVKLRGRRIAEIFKSSNVYIAQSYSSPAESHPGRNPFAALPGYLVFGLTGTDIIMLALLGKEREPGK